MKRPEINELQNIAKSTSEKRPFESHLVERLLSDLRPNNRNFAKAVADYAMAPERDLIVAVRRDGLCQRLISIVYGKLIADHLGLEFRLVWPSTEHIERLFCTKFSVDHALLDDPQEFFSAEFLAAHLSTEEEIGLPSWAIIGVKLTAKDYYLDRPEKYTNRDQIVRPFWIAPFDVTPEFERELTFSNARDLFTHALFCPEINDAIKMMAEVELPENCVVQHVRGGDVVYGAGRALGRPPVRGMTMPLITAEKICEIMTSLGKTVLVCGATSDDLRFLADKYAGVRTVEDLVPGRVPAHIAMITEIALMARCNQIIAAPGSSVGRLAALVGNMRVTPFSEVLSPSAEYTHLQHQVAHAEFEQYHDLQKSLAFFSLFSLTKDHGERESRGYLQDALRFDPHNDRLKALFWLSGLGHGWADEESDFRALFGGEDKKYPAQTFGRFNKVARFFDASQPAILRLLKRAHGACCDQKTKGAINACLMARKSR